MLRGAVRKQGEREREAQRAKKTQQLQLLDEKGYGALNINGTRTNARHIREPCRQQRAISLDLL
jgi:hypothetical protein